MKKIVFLVLLTALLAMSALIFASCGNYQMFDTTYSFNYAYVVWPDGTAEKLPIKSWMDYEGEQIQIKTADGNVYVFHSANCVLASENAE